MTNKDSANFRDLTRQRQSELIGDQVEALHLVLSIIINVRTYIRVPDQEWMFLI